MEERRSARFISPLTEARFVEMEELSIVVRLGSSSLLRPALEEQCPKDPARGHFYVSAAILRQIAALQAPKQA